MFTDTRTCSAQFTKFITCGRNYHLIKRKKKFLFRKSAFAASDNPNFRMELANMNIRT